MSQFQVQGNAQPTAFNQVGQNSIVAVSSLFAPPPGAANGTRIEVYDNIGNTLIHVSLRPGDNVIAINAKTLNSDWDYGKEVRVSFNDRLPSFKIAQITIKDNGTSYQVEFSDGNGVKFPKLLEIANSQASKVAYLFPEGRSVLSNPVNVTVTP